MVPRIMIFNPKLLAIRIDARLAESPRITLSQLAHEFGVSSRTIENLLRQSKGMSFRCYQQSVLLRLALELLVESGDLTIKSIAFSLGYRSPAAFSRFIRSKTGKKPSDFRRTTASDFA